MMTTASGNESVTASAFRCERSNWRDIASGESSADSGKVPDGSGSLHHWQEVVVTLA